MGFFYFDWTIIIVIPAMLFALYAQSKVKSTYNKYSAVRNMRGYTAREVARRILDENGLNDVQIEHISGNLTDHFDPKSNVIRLSDSVDNSTSVAAIGVAAHEVGHAIQHATNYAPVKIRTALVPVTNFGSRISTMLIMIGLIVAGFSQSGDTGFIIAIIGLLAYCLVAVFQFVTLPVEFNASNRALKTLENMGFLYDEEVTQAKKVLSAAALTYVAALAATLLTILRLFLIIMRSTGRNRRN
ncbi:MAG: zinc metallopeptidase [Ruminococcus sp.]|nr:zinc metallopeptidase [Ruminococcus sp.]